MFAAVLMGGMLRPLTLIVFVLSMAGHAAAQAGSDYPWLPEASDPRTALSDRISPPDGWQREPIEEGSFAAWLRGLPLMPDGSPVLLHDGGRKGRQDVHVAVVDVDVGTRDLQQCADAVMRLRAEYLFAAGRADEVHFNFTSGDEARWDRYRQGYRASVKGNDVSWPRRAEPDASHASFRRYLDLVFTYAGTHSLSKELDPVDDPAAVRAGDVFIQGGFPGHAVLVVDTAVNPATGERAFLLVQSYMPAQQIHLLKAPGSPLGAWYPAAVGDTLATPEWVFAPSDLRRFPAATE
jgi:hypothetical protein